ncbi:hypothetical protein ACH5RR_006893, partial [Cinchona calisaya]
IVNLARVHRKSAAAVCQQRKNYHGLRLKQNDLCSLQSKSKGLPADCRWPKREIK